MKSMIVLTNDDGIESPGLTALLEELSGLDEIVVVAPESQRSGSGKVISREFRLWESDPVGGVRRYCIDGTPADSVLAAIYVLSLKPRLLVSGINCGPNLGLEDAFWSGTVGAALEASIHGVPAIAASLALWRGRPCTRRDFTIAVKLVKRLVQRVLERGMPKGIDILNLNVPEGVVRGVVVTRMARSHSRGLHVADSSRFRLRDYDLRVYEGEPGTDVAAVLEGYASLTPISLSGLVPVHCPECRRLAVELEQALSVF